MASEVAEWGSLLQGEVLQYLGVLVMAGITILIAVALGTALV